MINKNNMKNDTAKRTRKRSQTRSQRSVLLDGLCCGLWARLETKAGDVESGDGEYCSARARSLFVFMHDDVWRCNCDTRGDGRTGYERVRSANATNIMARSNVL